jgi:ERCC4-related helicase
MLNQNIKPRLYQETILATAALKNSLVVLPTGMGKTLISVLLIVQRLKQYPNGKTIILAPTRPLCEQHLKTLKSQLTIDENLVTLFTGQIKPEKREILFKEKQIIITTPQGLEHDLINNRIKLKDVSLLVVDEAHRAVKNYAYTFIAKQYNKQARFPRILALTASPGADLEKIQEVCTNLYIEDIEVRSSESPDVKPYIQDVKINYIKVDLPESFKKVQKFLKDCYKSKINELDAYNYLKKNDLVSKLDLLKAQAKLHSFIAQGDKSFEILKSISLCAEATKVQHGLEMIETQGVAATYAYLEKIMQDALTSKTKAVQNLAKDLNFRSAYHLTKQYFELKIEHPKQHELLNLIKRNSEKRIIVFTNYRDTGASLLNRINEITKAELFVGQAKRNGHGLSQKQQKALIEQFSNGDFNVLLATSVAEEGLDIPQVDLVIFYEPVPSAIRSIQRRGRTGRLEKGEMIMLIAKGTRDEAYRWSSHHKEKRMHRILQDLKKSLSLNPREKDAKLEQFSEELTVVVDDREKHSNIVKNLIDLNVTLKMERLDHGDYLLGSRVGVEFKTQKDFVDSIVDGRLLTQIKDLKRNFEKPLLIIEGSEDIFSQRNIHPNAIRGMLSAIAVSYQVPIIYTKSSHETASLFAVIAKRELSQGHKVHQTHTQKRKVLKDQQEYIISSIPGVGSTLSKPLLRQFNSIKNIANAELSDLEQIEGIGVKKAKEIQRVLTEKYNLD